MIFLGPEDTQKTWKSEEPRGGDKGGGRAQGVGRAPLPCGLLEASLTWTPSLPGCFPSKVDNIIAWNNQKL